ncbi:hypothetical protein ACA910_019558 [Epithemia clementina (nom. ined.)]
MEATRDQNSEGLAIVHVLAIVLDRLCIANVAMAQADPGQVTKFHAMKAPGIGILQYLERIHKYASCSNECFILALIYIDRLIQRNNFLLTELNVHRVVITAILLAAKFFDDAYYNNAYYAKVGGVLVSEMNGLEVDFLFRINFSLHVTPEVFEKYRLELLSHAASCCIQPQVPTPAPISNNCATVTPSPPHQSPAMIQSSPQQHHQDQQMMMCNPQAPSTNNFHVTQHELNKASPENPFENCSRITPSSGPNQMEMSYVHSGSDSCCHTNSSKDSSTFQIQFSDGYTQIQRTQSYPTTNGGIYSHCCVPTAAPSSDSSCSAPVIITPGVPVHYPMANHVAAAAMMEHALYPLQNVLVHHNHHQAYALQPKPGSRDCCPAALLAAAAGAQ